MKFTYFISWLAVISIFIVTGLSLHSGFSSLELGAPSEGSSLSTTIEDIKRLDTIYAEAIESKAEFQHIWSLVALFAAAASAGAIALRAPQVVIITIGAYLAVVYGSLQLQTPDLIISSLAKARSSLSCLETPTRQLMISKEKYFDKISNLTNALEPNLKTIENYSVELDLYLRRLEEALKIKENERKEAVQAIDSALMLPVENNQLAIDELNKHLTESKRLKRYITNNIESETNKYSSQMLQKLFSIIEMLEDAHKILQMPELLQSELSYGSKKYLEQLVKSTKIQKTAHDQLDKTHIAMSKLVPTLNSLKVWPQNIEHASESAINAVKQVHSKLLAELAQAGPTQARLAQVISQLDLQIPKQLEKLTSEKQAYIEPTIAQQTLTPREYEEKIPFTKLQEKAAVLVSESEATLNKLTSNIAKAREISEQLEKISKKYLKVLENATKLFDKKTRTLNSTLEKYSLDLSKTLRLLTEAEQVIDQVNFIKINLEIESCVKLSQISY